jgi:hypothetical protein
MLHFGYFVQMQGPRRERRGPYVIYKELVSRLSF